MIHRVTMKDNELKRMTMSGTTRDTIDNKWQRVTASDNEWQPVTTNDNKWQQVVILANFPFFFK